MKNVAVAVKGNKLTLTVDFKKTQGESKSGKSIIIGTTSGNVPVSGLPADMRLNLTLYKIKP
jgi:hypothetical protein